MEAKELVAALVNSGLTQQQIGVLAGIPQPTVSKIFRGEVSDVMSRTYRNLKALYDARVANAGAAAS